MHQWSLSEDNSSAPPEAGRKINSEECYDRQTPRPQIRSSLILLLALPSTKGHIPSISESLAQLAIVTQQTTPELSS